MRKIFVFLFLIVFNLNAQINNYNLEKLSYDGLIIFHDVILVEQYDELAGENEKYEKKLKGILSSLDLLQQIKQEETDYQTKGTIWQGLAILSDVLNIMTELSPVQPATKAWKEAVVNITNYLAQEAIHVANKDVEKLLESNFQMKTYMLELTGSDKSFYKNLRQLINIKNTARDISDLLEFRKQSRYTIMHLDNLIRNHLNAASKIENRFYHFNYFKQEVIQEINKRNSSSLRKTIEYQIEASRSIDPVNHEIEKMTNVLYQFEDLKSETEKEIFLNNIANAQYLFLNDESIQIEINEKIETYQAFIKRINSVIDQPSYENQEVRGIIYSYFDKNPDLFGIKNIPKILNEDNYKLMNTIVNHGDYSGIGQLAYNLLPSSTQNDIQEFLGSDEGQLVALGVTAVSFYFGGPVGGAIAGGLLPGPITGSGGMPPDMKKEFEKIHAEFEKIHQRFDVVNSKLDTIQNSINVLNTKIDTLTQMTEKYFKENFTKLNEIIDGIDRTECKLYMLSDHITRSSNEIGSHELKKFGTALAEFRENNYEIDKRYFHKKFADQLLDRYSSEFASFNSVFHQKLLPKKVPDLNESQFFNSYPNLLEYYWRSIIYPNKDVHYRDLNKKVILNYYISLVYLDSTISNDKLVKNLADKKIQNEFFKDVLRYEDSQNSFKNAFIMNGYSEGIFNTKDLLDMYEIILLIDKLYDLYPSLKNDYREYKDYKRSLGNYYSSLIYALMQQSVFSGDEKFFYQLRKNLQNNFSNEKVYNVNDIALIFRNNIYFRTNFVQYLIQNNQKLKTSLLDYFSLKSSAEKKNLLVNLNVLIKEYLNDSTSIFIHSETNGLYFRFDYSTEVCGKKYPSISLEITPKLLKEESYTYTPQYHELKSLMPLFIKLTQKH